MRGQTFFVRLALRRMWRGQLDRRDEIREILRDDDLLGALTEELVVVSAREYGVGDGSFLDFFKFLMDNFELIFEIIAKLLILFGDDS